VSDVHIYYFMVWDPAAGGNMLFARPATLEAIAGRGVPVLESQIVVDHTDLDINGFLIIDGADDSHAINDQVGQTRYEIEAFKQQAD
jgi:hypothetical protein